MDSEQRRKEIHEYAAHCRDNNIERSQQNYEDWLRSKPVPVFWRKDDKDTRED